MKPKHEITALLVELKGGNQAVVDALMPLVYDELKALAHRQLLGEKKNRTLNTTALLNEAYLQLVDQKAVDWQNRAHFFSIAAIIMRRLLVREAHRRNAQKRGGGQVLATFHDDKYVRQTKPEELLALDEALTRLAESNERMSKVVELRFFGGLTQQEIAEVLGLSVSTLRRDWRLARAWLSRELLQMGIAG